MGLTKAQPGFPHAFSREVLLIIECPLRKGVFQHTLENPTKVLEGAIADDEAKRAMPRST